MKLISTTLLLALLCLPHQLPFIRSTLCDTYKYLAIRVLSMHPDETYESLLIRRLDLNSHYKYVSCEVFPVSILRIHSLSDEVYASRNSQFTILLSCQSGQAYWPMLDWRTHPMHSNVKRINCFLDQSGQLVVPSHFLLSSSSEFSAATLIV